MLTGCASTSAPRTLVMGSDGTPAMSVMAEIYAGALRKNSGTAVSDDLVIGDDAQLLSTMGRTEVDLFGAFTGTLLAGLAPELAPTTSDETYNDVNRSLPQGVSVGDETPVTNTPQLVVATSLATSTGVTDLSGCAGLPADLPVAVTGTPSDVTLRAFADAGCRLGAVQTLSDPQAVVTRVATGTALGILSPLQLAGEDTAGPAAQVQSLPAPKQSPGTSTAGASGTVPTAVGPRAEDLVPVYRTAALDSDQVKTVNKVAGEITTADLATMARRVQAGEKPRDLALTWLGEHGI
ncbi:glycine betaine ABC transporter substrate-binding protein [Gordonia sp. NPDC003376]